MFVHGDPPVGRRFGESPIPRSGLAAVEVNVRERRYGVFVNRDVKQINIGV